MGAFVFYFAESKKSGGLISSRHAPEHKKFLRRYPALDRFRFLIIAPTIASFLGEQMYFIYEWFRGIDWTPGAITAAATIVLAILTLTLALGTLGLWFATRRLVRGAEDTAERQLRAYVFLENALFEETGEDTWAIHYRIRNFGRTPAHKVEVAATANVVEWKNDRTLIPQPGTESVAFGSMAPGGDFFDNDVFVSDSCSLTDLKAGLKAIFLVGIIKYIDVFGVGRRTRLQYYIGGDVGCSGNEMSADDKGNDAN